MASTLDYFGITCIVIVIIQILRSVLPWIYENFLGPFLIGSSVKLKDMGEWACKFENYFLYFLKRY